MAKWQDENGKITRTGKFAIVSYAIIGALFVISIINYNSKNTIKDTKITETQKEEAQ